MLYEIDQNGTTNALSPAKPNRSIFNAGQIAVLSSIIRAEAELFYHHLLIHTFTKPKNVVTTISFGTSAEAADSE
jgi:hypothetical protein